MRLASGFLIPASGALLLVGAVTAMTPSRGPVAVAQQGQSRLVVFETFLTPG